MDRNIKLLPVSDKPDDDIIVWIYSDERPTLKIIPYKILISWMQAMSSFHRPAQLSWLDEDTARVDLNTSQRGSYDCK